MSDTLYALQGDADDARGPDAAEHAAGDSLDLVQGAVQKRRRQLSAGAEPQNRIIKRRPCALVKARAQRYADTAALFQALGGGWWNRTDVAANTPD